MGTTSSANAPRVAREVSESRAPRSQNRKGEGAHLRQELLEAASRVLARDGSRGLGLRPVAREAQVTAPAIYQHFHDIDALIWELLLQTWQKLADAMRIRGDAAADRGPFAVLEAQLDAYIDFATSNQTQFELLFSIIPDPELVIRHGNGATHPVYELLLETVQLVRSAGYVLPLPPEPSPDERADPSTVLLFVIAHGRVALGSASQVDEFSLPAEAQEFTHDVLRALVRLPDA